MTGSCRRSSSCRPRWMRCWPRPKRSMRLRMSSMVRIGAGIKVAAELARRESRLVKLRAARDALEADAAAKAEAAVRDKAEKAARKKAEKAAAKKAGAAGHVEDPATAVDEVAAAAAAVVDTAVAARA